MLDEGYNVTDSEWYDEVVRHKHRLAGDLVARNVGLAIACVLFAFFLPLSLVLSVYFVCLGSEFVDYFAFRRYLERPSRAVYAAIVSNSFVVFCAYSLLGLGAWNTGNPSLGLVGLFALAGALVNIATARATHLPFGIASGLPPAAALIWLASSGLSRGPVDAPGVVAAVGAATLVGYSASALVQNNRAGRRIAAETARANEASAAKSRFLAEMSHELRTPLNAILGLAQDLRSPAADGIEKAAHTLRMLVDDLMDLASTAPGDVVHRPVTSAVREELVAAARTLGPRPGGAAPRLPDFSPDLPELARFDPALTRKLIRHTAAMLHQGCDPYGTARPDAHLRCARAEGRRDRLRIDVILTLPAATPIGPGGFDPAAAPANALTARLVERICAVTGAEIEWAALSDVDRRATILIPAQPIDGLPEPGELRRGGPVRAIVVDDIATNRFVIVQLLRQLGMETTEASGAREVLALLDDAPADLVLLDLNMPGLSGEDAFAAIRTAGKPWSATPVIAVTADVSSERRNACLELGFDGYVPKPVDRRILWAEIAAALSARPPAPQ